MDDLFAFCLLLSLILFVVGLIKPTASLFWDKKSPTRKKSLLIYGISIIVFFILFGITTDRQKAVASSTDVITTNDQVEKKENSDYLFASSDDFKNAYNEYCLKANLDFIIDNIEVQEGEVQNTFQYMFNSNLGLIGTLDKQNGGLKEINMLGAGDGSFKSGSNIILCMLSIIATVGQSISPNKRVDILKELGFLGKKPVNLKSLSGKTSRNGIKYYVNSSELMGLMFGASKL